MYYFPFGKKFFGKTKYGFTLIELIVVLVLIGIIAGITVPRYTGSIDTIKFRRSMSEIMYFLREARIYAMKKGSQTMVILDVENGLCWNDEEEVVILPLEIELFSDNPDDSEKKNWEFVFYPNGTAREQKLGFSSGQTTSVLHVEPLGGLVYYKMDEEMEKVVLYEKERRVLSNKEIKKVIAKYKYSDTVSGSVSDDEYLYEMDSAGEQGGFDDDTDGD
ncbi:MAG: type II secretion system GspH family protein [Candidatus Brocadiaceae bacterium]|nr:type II secretion system GspH family protein [Candidatus Brocadiaceae bacterium]